MKSMHQARFSGGVEWALTPGGRIEKPPRGGLPLLSPVICVVSLRPLRPQLFDELRAQARDAAAIGTVSPTSSTGTTLTSFQ
jgi:hypothetical protein